MGRDLQGEQGQILGSCRILDGGLTATFEEELAETQGPESGGIPNEQALSLWREPQNLHEETRGGSSFSCDRQLPCLHQAVNSLQDLFIPGGQNALLLVSPLALRVFGNSTKLK